MVIGSIFLFAGSSAPEGFLVCDGSSVSRDTYSELFSVIGTTYGAGDGETTFDLPDMSGRVSVGASEGYAIGSTGGEESHVLTSNEIPSHTHTVPSHGHANTITATTPKLTHSITTQPSFTYVGPNTSTKYDGGGSAKGGSSSVNATRSTNVAITAHAATDCTMSGSITDCADITTNTAGSGVGHSNMQPFIVMNYIIYAGV